MSSHIACEVHDSVRLIKALPAEVVTNQATVGRGRIIIPYTGNPPTAFLEGSVETCEVCLLIR
jgi:hypothetical protein